MQTGIFLGMSSLESLNLGWNFLSSLSGDTFAGLSNLKQLYIYNNKLTALPDSIFLGLNKLEKLSLSGNIISYMPTAVYEQLKGYITRYYLGICSLLRSAVCY
jgi:Leucine-rich repeat (LRR) protein